MVQTLAFTCTHLDVMEDVSYNERTIRILNSQGLVPHGKTILLVKVLWKYCRREEATRN